MGRFLEAMATGDLDAIVATLHPDVVVVGDANGTTNTAINVIHGPEKFARFFIGLFGRYGEAAFEPLPAGPGQRPARLLDRRLGGRRSPAPARRRASPGSRSRTAWSLATYDVANPDKFAGVRLEP